MTTEEVGAYILLLCKAWREVPVASIPNDDKVLSRWARMSPARWAKCRASILSPFTLREDGRLYQGRLEKEFHKLLDSRREKSDKASRASRARWDRGNADAMHEQCTSNANASSKHMLGDAITYSSSIPYPIPIPDRPPSEVLTPPPPAVVDPTANWPHIESLFIAFWNGTPGVAKCGNGLPYTLIDQFRQCYSTPGWYDRARQALGKFPLKNGVRIGLKKFLDPATIDEILGGVHDWSKTDGNKPRNGGGNYDATAATRDPNHGKF